MQKCCAVCCRLLYPEEYCRLSVEHKEEIEQLFVQYRRYALSDGAGIGEILKLTWPLLNYRELDGEPIRQLDIHYPRVGATNMLLCVPDTNQVGPKT